MNLGNKPLRVLVCGSREWTDRHEIERHLKRLHHWRDGISVVIHGAYRGADAIADEVAKSLGIETLPFPADWKTLGAKAGPIRNSKMLAEGAPDLVMAFAYDLWHSDGTRDMVNKSVQAKVPVYWFPYRVKIEQEIGR